MYAEIRERRDAPDLAERTDVLSRLIRIGERRGRRRSTTPSCATSWSPCCSPATRPRRPRWPGRSTSSAATRELLRACQQAADDGDDDCLEAVIKESMRLHPVIPMVVRTLMKPATIGGIDLPAGATVGPSIIIAHQRVRQPSRTRAVPARAVPRPEPAHQHLDPVRRRRTPLHRRRLLADGGRGRAARGVRGVRRDARSATTSRRSATSPASRAAAPGSGCRRDTPDPHAARGPMVTVSAIASKTSQ